jgi:hypothetical protein
MRGSELEQLAIDLKAASNSLHKLAQEEAAAKRGAE